MSDDRHSTPPVSSLDAWCLHLHPRDDVLIARRDLPAGARLQRADGSWLQVSQPIPAGHKLALAAIPAGRPVHRYGQVIGLAARAIAAGEHVHDHNLVLGELAPPGEPAAGVAPVAVLPPEQRRTFLGYRRADGRVGTRNTIAVISTVNCSAHTARQIARHFGPAELAAFSNVDGVVALAGATSCAMQVGGPEYRLLQRTLAGMARHPNVGAALLVGLGCETNQVAALVENHALAGPYLRTLVIQEAGGVQKSIAAGIALVNELLPLANATGRTVQPVSGLALALQCGGSDAWSGVTANPLVGLVADELVRQGGTVLLAETPEIYGAEHLLVQRAIDPAVGRKLLDTVAWWRERADRLGLSLNNNPTPGNKAGGLSTIYEKALGAIAKGGHTPLTDVLDYAEPLRTTGCVFMNTPGFDPVAVTGQVAGGCNLVLFTTGRGSAFGFMPAPSIKIATNTALYQHMQDDMDLNAGALLDGADMACLAGKLFDLTVAVASGRPSRSEAQDIGEAEFCPWSLGEAL